MSTKPFGQKLAIIAVLTILIWLTIGILLYKHSAVNFIPSESKKIISNTISPELEIEACKSNGQKLSPFFWRKINLHERRIPRDVKDASSTFVVLSSTVTVQKSKVNYIYSKPVKSNNNTMSVLLLHGQSYTCETWNELGTLRYIAAFGYYVVAVDLPGYGHSPSISSLDKAQFMHDLIKELNLEKPIIISPSMSGSFSLRYLIRYADKIAGFVPIAPVSTSVLENSLCSEDDRNKYTHLNEDCERIKHYLKKDFPSLSCIKVPTLVVFGQRDRGENSAKLCLLPNGQGAEIPEGKHAAYLTNPDLWHKLLYNFLGVLNETLSCM